MKMTLCLLLASTIALFGEETPPTEETGSDDLLAYLELSEEQPKESPLYLQHPSFEPIDREESEWQRQVHYYVGGLFSTMGVGLRMYNRVGFEWDIAFIVIGMKSSLSVFQYFDSSRHVYIGIGMGVYASILDYNSFLQFSIPGYLGFEVKKFFCDLGCDWVIGPNISIPIPNLRLGLRF